MNVQDARELVDNLSMSLSEPVHRAIFDYYEDRDESDLDTLLTALANYHAAFED
jgi:hypothetical protein